MGKIKKSNDKKSWGKCKKETLCIDLKILFFISTQRGIVYIAVSGYNKLLKTRVVRCEYKWCRVDKDSVIILSWLYDYMTFVTYKCFLPILCVMLFMINELQLANYWLCTPKTNHLLEISLFYIIVKTTFICCPEGIYDRIIRNKSPRAQRRSPGYEVQRFKKLFKVLYLKLTKTILEMIC